MEHGGHTQVQSKARESQEPKMLTKDWEGLERKVQCQAMAKVTAEQKRRGRMFHCSEM